MFNPPVLRTRCCGRMYPVIHWSMECRRCEVVCNNCDRVVAVVEDVTYDEPKTRSGRGVPDWVRVIKGGSDGDEDEAA